jgi:hypothetical protein
MRPYRPTGGPSRTARHGCVTNAWQESYAGLSDKDRAYSLAHLLETLSLQRDRVPEGLQAETVRVSRWIVGDRS